MSKLKRYFIHMPHGILGAVLLATPGLHWLGVCWVFLIVMYQYLEDWRIKDLSYIDFRGYMIGYAVVAVALAIWRVFL